MKARYLIRNKYFVWWLQSLLPLVYKAFAVILLLPPLLSASGFSYELYETNDKRIIYSLNAIFSLCALFFVVCSFTRKLYFRAKLFYAADEKATAPSRFFCFSLTFRYMVLRLFITVNKLLRVTAFFFPSFAVFFILFTGIRVNGSMVQGIFFTLLALGITLFILGFAFSFAVNGRYFICDYLFYLNPRMSPGSTVKTARSLLAGKIVSTAFCRISLLPWSLLSVFLLPMPFASVFTEACKVYLAEEIYSERKYYRNYSRLLSEIRRQKEDNHSNENREADKGLLPRI